ncbi:hypothetical protein ABK040_001878 [Willaertia magna]
MLHWVWFEYGTNSDSKWLILDGCVTAVELLTCTFDSLCCLIILYAMLFDKSYRHFWQIVLCVCELYGDWMTFVPALLEGGENLNTDPYYLWVYTIGSNGVWVVVPLLLLIQSFNHVTKALNNYDNKNVISIKAKIN